MLYASSTDYSTYGDIDIYNHNNSLVYSFQCGVSPGKIIFDIRNTTTGVYDIFYQDNEKHNVLYDMSGRTINHSNSVVNGVYISNGKKFYINR